MLKGNINRGKIRDLDQRIWVMGNTSIAHSKKLAAGDDNPFAVIFDPAEVDKALEIPNEDIHIQKNTLFPGLAEPELCKAICFPFAQHYIADSPGCRTFIKDQDDLIRKYNSLWNSGTLKTFSANTIIRQVSVALAISILIAVFLMILL